MESYKIKQTKDGWFAWVPGTGLSVIDKDRDTALILIRELHLDFLEDNKRYGFQ